MVHAMHRIIAGPSGKAVGESVVVAGGTDICLVAVCLRESESGRTCRRNVPETVSCTERWLSGGATEQVHIC